MWRLVVIFVIFFFALPIVFSSSRDIFNYKENKMASRPLQDQSLNLLGFLGVVRNGTIISGFVQDARGNIYVVKLGDRIGKENARVIKILNEAIILAEGEHFVVIK